MYAGDSERVNAAALEMLRNHYGSDNVAVIVICMPGSEKRFSRCLQLYIREGFACECHPLTSSSPDTRHAKL